jgi:hypothetical protein
MDDRTERALSGLDAERPLPVDLFRRVELALIDDAAARDAEQGGDATAALLKTLDAPRPLPPTARSAIELALVRRPNRTLPAVVAAAAVVVLVAASVAALTFGRANESGREVASRPPRSVPVAEVPPLLSAPAASTTVPMAAPAPTTTRPRTTSTTTACRQPCRGGGGGSSASPGNASGPIPAAASMPPPPYVAGVEPSEGPTAGGTAVTVRGAGFTGANGVLFGSTPSTNFTVVSDSEIRAVTPAADKAQTVPVSVTFPSGTTSASMAGFTYTS